MKKNVENLKINSSAIMRLISLTIMLAFVMPVMTNAQAGKANFAGTWAFNAEKSALPQQGQDQGGRMRMGGGDFVVQQEANLLTVSTTRTNQNGESVTTTSKYTLDGKESVNTTGRGDSKSVAKWSADGKTLTIVTTSSFNMNGETRDITSTEEWALADSKTLTRTTTRTTPNGDMTTKLAYDKK